MRQRTYGGVRGRSVKKNSSYSIRANYRICSKALYGDDETLLLHPELLEDLVPACRSAAWFWWANGLNSIADGGDFRKITRVINGGFNGYDERLAYYQRAQTVLA